MILMFQLTQDEKDEVVANCDHLKTLKYSPNLPYVFTEYGAIMLANVLNNDRAIEVNIQIVRIFTKMREVLSDERGRFYFKHVNANSRFIVTSIGHELVSIQINEFKKAANTIVLLVKSINLSEVTISTGAAEQYRSISKLDIKIRGINNSQEVLRMVPGLFIGQHAGGGKAEQIFLRGFDIDHGAIPLPGFRVHVHRRIFRQSTGF